jgi:hypothetical protein
MDDYVTVEGDFQTESDLAVCLDVGGADAWIPKTLIADWDEDAHERGEPVEVQVEEWFASKEGLI